MAVSVRRISKCLARNLTQSLKDNQIFVQLKHSYRLLVKDEGILGNIISHTTNILLHKLHEFNILGHIITFQNTECTDSYKIK